MPVQFTLQCHTFTPEPKVETLIKPIPPSSSPSSGAIEEPGAGKHVGEVMDPKSAEAQAAAAKHAAAAENRPSPDQKSDSQSLGSCRHALDPRAFGSNEWLEANLALETHYLTLSRPHIEEMCLDLQPILSDQIRKALASRLRDRSKQSAVLEADPVAAAIAAVADLAGDVSWALTWEQTKQLVEPYAKGSWLLAQIQAREEERLIAIYAAELTKQIAGYVQDLILRAYGVATQGADQAEPRSERRRHNE